MKFLYFFIVLFTVIVNSQTVIYQGSNSIINNPERGFYHYTSTGSNGGYNLLSQTTLQNYRTNENITVIQRQFFLRDFISGVPISTSYLANMQTDFNRIRAAGAKVIIRFTYSSSSSTTVYQPTKAQILFHMKQLVNVLTVNKDIIVSIQAGFIGKYGEWYYTGSSEFGDGNFTLLTNAQWINRKEIVDYMINNFPPEIPIQLRYVFAKQKMYGNTFVGRIGFYNDSFLGTWGDSGTFVVSSSQGQPSTADVTYWQNNTFNNPVSGETNMLNPPRTDCLNAMTEMNRYNWGLINKDYFPNVISGWQTNGCFSDIQTKIGYKFELISSTISNNNISISLKNSGWANLIRNRKVYLVFDNNINEYKYEITTTENWKKNSIINLSVSLNYPILNGTYKLYLYIPDNANTDVNYAIQFSNMNVWIPQKGYNDLFQTYIKNTAPSNVLKVYNISGSYIGNSVENLEPGIYILKFYNDGLIETKKIKI